MSDWISVHVHEDDPIYIFCINNEKLAIVYFIGGHVERPDEWVIKFKEDMHCQGNRTTFSLERAKQIVEEHFGVI